LHVLVHAPACAAAADALRLMVEALSRASLYNTAGQAKNTGNCTSGAFDFAAEYVHQDQLYGLEGRELSIMLDSNQQQQQQEYDESQQPQAHAATHDGSHYGPQWALLRFDQPVTAPAVSSLTFSTYCLPFNTRGMVVGAAAVCVCAIALATVARPGPPQWISAGSACCRLW
jgi:hypothetical protein